MNNSNEVIILAHGLLRNKYSMWVLSQYLKKHNYQTLLFGYKSRKVKYFDVAEDLKKFIDAKIKPNTKIHFVAHSMGNIVTRSFLNKYSEYNIGKFVMLGPPNQGSQVARFLSKFSIFNFLIGPNLKELSYIDLPKKLPFEVGIIAGGTKCKYGLLPILKGDNDLIVTVEETYLDSYKDHIVLLANHSMMMYYPSVKRKALKFLQTGCF